VRERECEITAERIKKIIAAGANVVFMTGGIDDMSLKVGLTFHSHFIHCIDSTDKYLYKGYCSKFLIDIIYPKEKFNTDIFFGCYMRELPVVSLGIKVLKNLNF
jgi:hypothetical protein